MGVVHRDLKMKNIMIQSSANLRIIDFGLAIRVKPSKKLKSVCGTAAFMAPELHKYKAYRG
jgi:serine/threonine protein kinase